MTVCYWCGAKDTLADVGKELDDGKYKMVQCSKCKNAYYVLNKEKMNKPKQMTNEEWFCQLTTEEKAKWMAKHMSFCEVCEIQTCRGDGCQRFDRGSMTEMDAFREWLKQPYHEKE